MNVKEIGKELMGKSLNSYHRRTGLTQLEENDKMQDGILNGILSQVDDAYIEKTEQSNVIHLDGSGDGVVVLDSIEGHTMVNLCGRMNTSNTQWILNNGWWELNKEGVLFLDFEVIVKPSTLYTVIMNTKLDNSGGIVFGFRKDNLGWNSSTHSTKLNGVNKFKFTTSSEETNRFTLHRGTTVGETTTIGVKDIMILEGDWTNKEIPASYFEGLQSSFEEYKEEDKYKIEILMNNKNLLDTSKYIISQTNGSIGAISNNILTLGQVASSGMYCEYQSEFIKVKEETVYSLSSHITEKNGANANHIMRYYDDNKKQIGYSDGIDNGVGSYTRRFTTTKGTKYIKFCIGSHTSTLDNTLKSCKVDLNRVMLKIGDIDTNVVSYKSNKIKLLINEPLRAIETFKDKLCVKDGQLVIERNLGEDIIDGSERWEALNYPPMQNGTHYQFTTHWSNKANNRIWENSKFVKCDRLTTVDHRTSWSGADIDGIGGDINRAMITFKNSTSPFTTISEVKQWLSQNPLKVVYPLAEPYYEEVTNEFGEPIILEGYENGTLYIDSTIIPTTTVRYTPKLDALNTLKEVNNNNVLLTSDINDAIIPYMLEVDMMILEKEMAIMSHKNIRKIGEKDMTSMQKRTYDMLARLIKGKTLTVDECKTRVTVYLNADKITDAQAEELMLLISEIYA